MTSLCIFLAGFFIASLPVKNKVENSNLEVLTSIFMRERAIYGYNYEDFESWPPAYWTLNPESGTGSWGQSPLLGTPYMSPQEGASGDHAAEFDCWDYNAGVYGDLISPSISLVNHTASSIDFYFWNHTDQTGYGNNDSTILFISTDRGSTWIMIDVLKGDVDDWTEHSYDLTPYIGDTILVRFRGVSDYGGSNMGIDFVRIGEPPTHDAGVVSILCPTDYVTHDSTIVPQIMVTNVGQNTEDFAAYLKIDSLGTTVYEDSQGVTGLDPLESRTVDFPPWTNSGGNVYCLTTYTSLPEDGYPLNDSLRVLTRSYITQRMVIGELITNTSCGPCLAANDTLDSIYIDESVTLSLIRYHCWWPDAYDPFYRANIIENSSRVNYYGVDYAPHLWIDGNVDGDAERDVWRSIITTEKKKGSPLDISLSGNYPAKKGQGNIVAEIEATGEIIDSLLFIRYAIVESEISYDAPNGQTIFRQTFRDMFPNTSGVPLDIIRGETVVDSHNFLIMPNWVADNCDIVVFVQSDANKHILQGARIGITELSGIEETSNLTMIENALYCPTFNSFKDKNEICFSIERDGFVTLSIYDVTGRLVQTLVNGLKKSGMHRVEWKYSNISSGIYFCRLETSFFSKAIKVVVIR